MNVLTAPVSSPSRRRFLLSLRALRRAAPRESAMPSSSSAEKSCRSLCPAGRAGAWGAGSGSGSSSSASSVASREKALPRLGGAARHGTLSSSSLSSSEPSRPRFPSDESAGSGAGGAAGSAAVAGSSCSISADATGPPPSTRLSASPSRPPRSNASLYPVRMASWPGAAGASSARRAGRVGGSVWYRILPEFQSCSTERAVPSRSGTAPRARRPFWKATRRRKPCTSTHASSGILYTSARHAGETRARIAWTGSIGSSTSSALSTLRRSAACRAACATSALAPGGAAASANTMPGQSSRRTCRSSITPCTTLVWPGVAATPHTRERLSELIRLLLPTLGAPTMPTVMLVLRFRFRE